jgi:four helix bundle protein
MRKAAVSVASNIVEGCARHSESDYLRFLDMAYGSVRELEYQISLAVRLGYLDDEEQKALVPLAAETSKVLGGLIRALRRKRGSGAQ